MTDEQQQPIQTDADEHLREKTLQRYRTERNQRCRKHHLRHKTTQTGPCPTCGTAHKREVAGEWQVHSGWTYQGQVRHVEAWSGSDTDKQAAKARAERWASTNLPNSQAPQTEPAEESALIAALAKHWAHLYKGDDGQWRRKSDNTPVNLADEISPEALSAHAELLLAHQPQTSEE